MWLIRAVFFSQAKHKERSVKKYEVVIQWIILQQNWYSIINQTSIASTRIYLRKIRRKKIHQHYLHKRFPFGMLYLVAERAVCNIESISGMGENWLFYPSVYCYAFRLRLSSI